MQQFVEKKAQEFRENWVVALRDNGNFYRTQKYLSEKPLLDNAVKFHPSF